MKYLRNLGRPLREKVPLDWENLYTTTTMIEIRKEYEERVNKGEKTLS